MPFPHLFRLLAFASLATLLTGVAQPASAAITNAGAHNNLARNMHHAELARSKRSQNQKRCKTRPSSVAPSSTAKPTSSSSAAPKPSPSANTAKANTPSTNTTSSPSTAPPASPPPSGGNSGKGGMAWASGSTNALMTFYNSNKISGLYDWNPDGPSQMSSLPYPFFPMLWGGDQARVDAFNAVAKKGTSDIYMGFNECNEPGECNMSPSDAAGVWKANLTPLKNQGKTLVCPVTSSNPNGFTWVQDFFSSCGSDCDCDILALHWYDTTFAKFQTYVEKWHSAWPDKQVWITEFSCVNFNNDGNPQPTYDEVKSFFQQAVAWMNQPEQSYITKYMPFGWSSPPGGGVEAYNAMVNSDLSLTELGHIALGI